MRRLMMARWSQRVTLWILPLMIIAALLALAWHTQNLPIVKSELLSACDLPCWGGLTPGLTGSDQIVPSLIATYYQLMVPMPGSAPLISFGGVIADQSVSGVIEFEGRNVSRIRLNTSLSLAHLLDMLGTPDCVNILPPVSRNVMDAVWRIDDKYIRTLLEADSHGRLMPTMWLESLEIGVGNAHACHNGSLPWLGFAPLWRYQAEGSVVYPTGRVVGHSP